VYYNAGLFREEGDEVEIEVPVEEVDMDIFGLFVEEEEEVPQEQMLNIQPDQEEDIEIDGGFGLFD